ncbi:MAG: N-acetyl sugar amidotransferase [Fibrobacteria bacterium]
MKYCQKCVLPDTRPNLMLDADGVCDACGSSLGKRDVDWPAREADFRAVVNNAKAKSKGYDCLIPVSGGKDSTWQVVRCLEYGLNPLAVTWRTPARTPIGQSNLDNLISLGVDHIDYQVNPKVERKFLILALEKYGSTAVPMHMALFNIPLRIAAKFDIPLVVYGENSAAEYGGKDEAQKGFKLDGNWLRRFGVTHGTTAADWVGPDLSEKEMTPYFGPNDAEMEAKGISAIFLGHYFPWDPLTSLESAKRHGFRVREEGPKTGYYNFADIDDDFISIHHFIKWYKFGFTRLWDNLSLEIRNGRMTRDEAVKIIRERGDETPQEDIAKFCAFTAITEARLFEIAETFRNKEIWKREGSKWTMPGFLIPDWRWK